MKVDVNDTIMIVVGSGLVPEEKDRPLAYRLKSRIDPLGKSEYQRSVVVSDIWYLENILFQTCSTVIIGGPGVNEASQHFFNSSPLIWTFEDMAFMQLDQEREIRSHSGDESGRYGNGAGFLYQRISDPFSVSGVEGKRVT